MTETNPGLCFDHDLDFAVLLILVFLMIFSSIHPKKREERKLVGPFCLGVFEIPKCKMCITLRLGCAVFCMYRMMSLYEAAYAHVDCQTCTSEILTRAFTSTQNSETPNFSLSQAEKSETCN